MSLNTKIVKFKINSYFDFFYMATILRQYNILLFAQHPKLDESKISEIPTFNLSTESG